MTFDLGRIMEQKQERECARLDEFDFRFRARTIKLVAAWVHSRSQNPASCHPSVCVREIATRPIEHILLDLRAAVSTPVDDALWSKVISRAQLEARTSLLEELGDPTPIRLG